MGSHSPQGFVFTAEMGARLRQLRGRAKLSLQDLAHVMGHPVGYASHLSRLEQGKNPYPSFALVADFLRACRASFSDLLPVLGGYTDQPPVRETRAREHALAGLAGDGSRDAVRLAVYDRKTAEARRAAGQKPVLPGKRAAALSRQLVSAREQRALATVVETEVTRLGVNPTLAVRVLALDYGRMSSLRKERATARFARMVEHEVRARRRRYAGETLNMEVAILLAKWIAGGRVQAVLEAIRNEVYNIPAPTGP